MRVAKQNGRYAYTDEMMRKSLKLREGSQITLSRWVGRGKEDHMQRIEGRLVGIYPHYILLEVTMKKGKYRECFLNKDIFFGNIKIQKFRKEIAN